MLNTRCLILLAAIASFPVAVSALSPDSPGPHHDRMVEMQDADHDGFISFGEHVAWSATVFRTMDSNNDGRLTREEYMAVHMGPAFASSGSKSRMTGMRQHAQTRKAECSRRWMMTKMVS